ncbi:collagen-like protein [Nocardioides sp. 616]|uniref:collagen-like triple helix repeat-containing protein n=1 Tax=Nocardioides sp. 616 TaxID=2268090 RepID=UPI000CE53DB9|nr:collagen-like protein [Nocardioides sp. 616]
MSRSSFSLRRSVPTVLIAGGLLVATATGGATAALVITGKDIKNDSVTSADIKDGSLKKKDLTAGAITKLAGTPGPVGPAGPAGVRGPSGAAGAPGVSAYEIVRFSKSATDNKAEVTLSCPAGKKVMGATSFWETSWAGTSQLSFENNTTVIARGTTPETADRLVVNLTCAAAS